MLGLQVAGSVIILNRFETLTSFDIASWQVPYSPQARRTDYQGRNAPRNSFQGASLIDWIKVLTIPRSKVGEVGLVIDMVPQNNP